MVQRNSAYLRVRPQDGVYCPVRIVVDDQDFFALEGDLSFYIQKDERGRRLSSLTREDLMELAHRISEALK